MIREFIRICETQLKQDSEENLWALNAKNGEGGLKIKDLSFRLKLEQKSSLRKTES